MKNLTNYRLTKTLFFISALFLLNQIIYTQEKNDWFKQESNTTQNLKGVFFIDTLRGLAVGDNVILKTTNGGGNWIATNSEFYWNDVYFLDSLTGFIAGKNGKLYKTTDGGLTYTPKTSGVTDILKNIYFKDSLNGFVGGEVLNEVILTNDGGDNWYFAPHLPILAAVFRDYYFLNDSLGWAIGIELKGGGQFPTAFGLILKTVDGGYTWETNYQNSISSSFDNVIFFNDSIGFVMGMTGEAVETRNTGNTWQLSSVAYLMQSICKADSLTGYMVGQYGSIYKTENAGLNWSLQETDSSKFYYDVFFTDKDHGWIVGNNGIVMCTKKYDPITSIKDDFVTYDYHLFQNYPNPFNSSTNIEFQVANFGFVSLDVYDILGRKIKTLINEVRSAGNYIVNFKADDLPSGIYIYRLISKNYSKTQKMILLK